MEWRRTGRVWSAALLTIGTTVALAQSASAQRDGYERILAGIRLNSSAKDVLRRFGNPNQIVIGDVGMRTPPAQGGGAQGGGGSMMGGPPGMMGGPPPGLNGPGGNLPGGPNKGGGGPPPGMMGGGAGMRGAGGPMMGAGGPGMMGGGSEDGMPGMGGGGGSMMGGPPGMGGGGSMMGGPPGMGGMGGGMMGGGGPGVGPFGQTTSTTARQQEVTWIYNRKFTDVKKNTNVVSYEFLVGPGGRISQIRVLGYYSKGTRTQRGVVLGSTYKDLVRLYGYPEEHIVNNGVLIASYKNRAHAQFQLIQNKPGADPSLQNYKIIAITIASVE